MDIGLCALLFIMIAAGLLGGLINFLIANHLERRKYYIVTSFTIGVGASLLVPLFLSTLESNLLEQLTSNSGTISDLFVFFGFCLLASISSRNFIETLSSKLLNEIKDVKQQNIDRTDQLLEKQSNILDKNTQLEEKINKVESQLENNRKIAWKKLADNNVKEALDIYDFALAYDPNDIESLIGKSRCLSRIGRIDEALGVIQHIFDNLLKNDNSPQDNYRKGRCIYNRACYRVLSGDYSLESILEELKQAFDLIPTLKSYSAKDEDLALIRDEEGFKNIVQSTVEVDALIEQYRKDT